MHEISIEDYHNLEAKIHTAIQKIFAEFMEELENRDAGSDDTVALHKSVKHDLSSKSLHSSIISGNKQQVLRKSRQPFDIDKIVYGITPADKKRMNVLESDLSKIFWKKNRKRSH